MKLETRIITYVREFQNQATYLWSLVINMVHANLPLQDHKRYSRDHNPILIQKIISKILEIEWANWSHEEYPQSFSYSITVSWLKYYQNGVKPQSISRFPCFHDIRFNQLISIVCRANIHTWTQNYIKVIKKNKYFHVFILKKVFLLNMNVVCCCQDDFFQPNNKKSYQSYKFCRRIDTNPENSRSGTECWRGVNSSCLPITPTVSSTNMNVIWFVAVDVERTNSWYGTRQTAYDKLIPRICAAINHKDHRTDETYETLIPLPAVCPHFTMVQ
jgi:hypothetical protein